MGYIELSQTFPAAGNDLFRDLRGAVAEAEMVNFSATESINRIDFEQDFPTAEGTCLVTLQVVDLGPAGSLLRVSAASGSGQDVALAIAAYTRELVERLAKNP